MLLIHVDQEVQRHGLLYKPIIHKFNPYGHLAMLPWWLSFVLKMRSKLVSEGRGQSHSSHLGT